MRSIWENGCMIADNADFLVGKQNKIFLEKSFGADVDALSTGKRAKSEEQRTKQKYPRHPERPNPFFWDEGVEGCALDTLRLGLALFERETSLSVTILRTNAHAASVMPSHISPD